MGECVRWGPENHDKVWYCVRSPRSSPRIGNCQAQIPADAGHVGHCPGDSDGPPAPSPAGPGSCTGAAAHSSKGAYAVVPVELLNAPVCTDLSAEQVSCVVSDLCPRQHNLRKAIEYCPSTSQGKGLPLLRIFYLAVKE